MNYEEEKFEINWRKIVNILKRRNQKSLDKIDLLLKNSEFRKI